MELEIYLNGRRLITTAEAARDRGITLAGMRKVLSQSGIRPVTHLDRRTPLYDPADVARLNPPGRGAYRRSAT